MGDRTSRRAVRRWLEEWDYIINGGPPKEEIVGNSGSRPVDGITVKMCNKITLEMAYGALPLDLRRVAYYRWVSPRALSWTLNKLKYTKDQYYYRCDKVVTFIYHYVNGERDCL